ncbi:unnamed protein product [Ilex paraguariensis]|uniref:Uncharacterized protein n=1 Tax=Ilex paraguariensis TaxID=185542 RepID=A0ABC8TNB7_9AQUA
MENTHSRRRQSAGIPPSPRLQRSKSGTPAISLPDQNHSLTSNSRHRSKSTTRSRTHKEEENSNTLTKTPSTQNKPLEKRHSFVNFLQTRSTSPSPSAWALSPGRSSPCSMVPNSPSSGRVLKKELISGGINGVLKYFRQKKTPPIQEEGYHRFRVVHNRLLQWRFVNARAVAAMAAVKIVAGKKLFNVWVRIFIVRNSMVDKKIQMQRFKNEIKLHQIMSSQVCLLKQWARLESRNVEAVSRLTRKLSAISINLHLLEDAKADVLSVHDAMSTATGVMDSIITTITKFHSQVIGFNGLVQRPMNRATGLLDGLDSWAFIGPESWA